MARDAYQRLARIRRLRVLLACSLLLSCTTRVLSKWQKSSEWTQKISVTPMLKIPESHSIAINTVLQISVLNTDSEMTLVTICTFYRVKRDHTEMNFLETSSPSPPERRMMQRKTQQFFQSQPTNRHNHNQYEHPQFEPSNTQQSKYHANANIYDYDQADSLHSLTTAYNSQSMPGPYDQSQSFRSGQCNYDIQSTTHNHILFFHLLPDPIDEFEYEEQELRSQQPVYNNQQRHTRGSNPRNAHGTRLRPVSELR